MYNFVVIQLTKTKFDHPVDAVSMFCGSSRVNPEESKAVSNNRITKSFTALSFLSASAFSLSVSTMGWTGLISRCFLAVM